MLGEIAGLADRGRAEIDDDLAAPDVLEDAVAFEHRAHMFRAGQAQEQQIALLDRHRRRRPRSRRRRRAAAPSGSGDKVERNDALAALLHEIAADRLAHHAKADEADGLVF